MKHVLLPLQEDEVRRHIRLRLQDAGDAEHLMNDACCRIVYQFSGGVPRLINMLCDRGLLMGYVRGRLCLDETILQDAIKEIL